MKVDRVLQHTLFQPKKLCPYVFLATGMHAFDILNDDARTREIIKATLAFLQEHVKQ